MKINRFFAELKRRNVYKVAIAYAVVAWLLIAKWFLRNRIEIGVANPLPPACSFFPDA